MHLTHRFRLLLQHHPNEFKAPYRYHKSSYFFCGAFADPAFVLAGVTVAEPPSGLFVEFSRLLTAFSTRSMKPSVLSCHWVRGSVKYTHTTKPWMGSAVGTYLGGLDPIEIFSGPLVCPGQVSCVIWIVEWEWGDWVSMRRKWRRGEGKDQEGERGVGGGKD